VETLGPSARTKLSLFLILVLTLLTVTNSVIAQRAQAREQNHFSAEDEGVQKPVPLPEDVLAILRKDDTVKGALEDSNLPPDRLPQSWFSASSIHLSSPDQADLIVMGQPPVTGANVTTFWVFRATPHGYLVVMAAAPAHDLIVTNTRSNGYRNIELWSLTAVKLSTVACRFDGEKYVVYRRKSSEIP
jgi:hypothetical protein